jgi:hypothetical protein
MHPADLSPDSTPSWTIPACTSAPNRPPPTARRTSTC